MPTLTRPDGAEIHWEERGAGPPLFLSGLPIVSMPSNFDALVADLAADHRVIRWDARGVGRSSEQGPYDLETDAADLAALIEEQGPGGVVVAVGNPAPLAIAAPNPELVATIVLVGALPRLQPPDGNETESLLHSDSVTSTIRQMAQTEPRALLRSMITLGNPQLSEAEVRERWQAQLEYCPTSSGVPRTESYLTYDTTRGCVALGDRLWIVHFETPFSPGHPLRQMRAVLPEAHIVEVDDGPLSRPDLTAAVVREAAVAVRPA